MEAEPSPALNDSVDISTTTPLLEQAPPEGQFTRQDVLVLVAICLAHFGDAVEIYLPGVITQVISCELEISPVQEGFLAAVLYSFYTVGCFTSGVSANYIGRRRTILGCLYGTFLVAAVAALSPNFTVLLISRGLTGLLVGGNCGISKLYWVEVASSVGVKNKGLLFTMLSWSSGAGYVPLLAYFTLHSIGWRFFLVMCSLPAFVLPLYLMQFHLPDSPVYLSLKRTSEEPSEVEVHSKKPEGMPLQVKLLIAKLSLIYFVCIYQGWGHILFLPSLYRAQNEHSLHNRLYCHAIYDNQFLKMTIISGVFPVLAKSLGFFTQPYVGLVKMMVISSSLTTVSFGVMFFVRDEVLIDITMTIIKATFALLNVSLWYFMVDAFDVKVKATSMPIIDGSSKLGALIGSLTVAFLPTTSVITIMLILGVIQLVTTCSMLNKNNKFSG